MTAKAVRFHQQWSTPTGIAAHEKPRTRRTADVADVADVAMEFSLIPQEESVRTSLNTEVSLDPHGCRSTAVSGSSSSNLAAASPNPDSLARPSPGCGDCPRNQVLQ